MKCTYLAYVSSIGITLLTGRTGFTFFVLVEGPLVILIGCMIFLSQFLYVIKMATVSLSCTARLWIFLPVECFPLTFDLNDFKSRINRLLLSYFLVTPFFAYKCF